MSINKLPVVSIVGLPNSGKSTLFNRLTHSSHAITSKTEHTTRDINRGTVKYQSQAFELVDTAGYTNEKDRIKQSAMKMLNESLQSSELILFVVDGSTLVTQSERELAKFIHKSGIPALLLVNKSDQKNKTQEPKLFLSLGFSDIFSVSGLIGYGIDELIAETLKRLPKKSAKKKHAIEVAILGRPNVGKSSLLNALARKKLAIESENAGTTRDVNQFELNFFGQPIHLYDTAGLRRPGKIGKSHEIEFFSSVRTKKAVENADICLVLIDANEGVNSQDQRILGMVKDTNKALIIVMSKWDKCEKDDMSQNVVSSELRSKVQYVYWAPVIFTSAHNGQNLEHLKKLILEVNARMDFTLSTSAANRFLEEANAKNPPSAIKTRRPKTNYITQTGERPPKFSIFATHPEYMHWSYTRYLQNRMRKQFELEGVPIVIEYRSKYGAEAEEKRLKKKQ